MAQDSKPPNSMGNITNNQGIITQGQIGNNTINVGPTKLIFDQAIAEELVGKLPAGKPVRLQGIGSQNDQAVVSQYQQFLQNRGFQVVRDMIGMMAPSPDHKITLGDPNAAQMVVIMAPSAN